MTDTPSAPPASTAEQPDAAEKGKNDLLLKAGIGAAAIGSAAIVAALLYVNRPGNKDGRS